VTGQGQERYNDKCKVRSTVKSRGSETGEGRSRNRANRRSESKRRRGRRRRYMSRNWSTNREETWARVRLLSMDEAEAGQKHVMAQGKGQSESQGEV